MVMAAWCQPDPPDSEKELRARAVARRRTTKAKEKERKLRRRTAPPSMAAVRPPKKHHRCHRKGRSVRSATPESHRLFPWIVRDLWSGEPLTAAATAQCRRRRRPP